MPKESKSRTSEKFPVICQKWEESERGWGVRPDGYSLHLSLEGLEAFVKAYWEKMPASSPDEYSRPSGEPFVHGVDKKLYNKVKASKNGIWHTEKLT